MAVSYGTLQTPTVTNLQSLASSATGAWASGAVDNTTDLFDDVIIQVVLSFANTAPANDKAAYVLAYGTVDTSSPTYTDPITGTEGAVTLTSFTNTGQNVRQIGILPYHTQNAVIESSPLFLARAFDGWVPPKWGLVVVNYSGAALNASGNVVKYIGVKRT